MDTPPLPNDDLSLHGRVPRTTGVVPTRARDTIQEAAVIGAVVVVTEFVFHGPISWAFRIAYPLYRTPQLASYSRS